MDQHAQIPAPAELLEIIERSTRRLIASVRTLDDRDLRALSQLPGWTRGHVLAHVARNAEALINLLSWASTGVEAPMYRSRVQRDADIEAGAPRPLTVHVADLEQAHHRFMASAATMTHQAWTAPVRYGARNTAGTGAWVPMLRIGEIEIHHSDLDVGYAPAQWPATWVAGFLPSAINDLRQRAGEPLGLLATDTGARLGDDSSGVRVVHGPQALLLAWVTGRTAGAGLTVNAGGPLPDLGRWR